MLYKEDYNYLINNPIFHKYRIRFDFSNFKLTRYIKYIFINERIVEMPFAIQSVGALPQGSKILDLGCTESYLPLQLAGLGYKVTGFDFREYPYTHPNLNFFRGDILKLPFEDGQFDAVLGISTIEHIGLGFYKDPLLAKSADQKAIQEAYRVLKNGGMLVLTVPYGVALVNEHHRIYDEESLNNLLQSYTIEEQRYFCNSLEGTEHGRLKFNCWKETNREQASEIESGESAECVCLIRAKK